MNITVLLADDHRIMREALRHMLEQESGIQVVGEAGDGRSAVQMVKDLVPNVVVMDIGMKDLNGVEATRQILKAHPEVRIIALSTFSDPTFVLQMIEAGASGYIVKADAYEELLRGIRAAADNKKYLSSEVAGVVIEGYQRQADKAAPSSGDVLGGREREVLQLVAEGKSSKEIAARLYISLKTVEAHRRNIMDKLNLHGVADLTKYAVRHGVASLDS